MRPPAGKFQELVFTLIVSDIVCKIIIYIDAYGQVRGSL